MISKILQTDFSFVDPNISKHWPSGFPTWPFQHFKMSEFSNLEIYRTKFLTGQNGWHLKIQRKCKTHIWNHFCALISHCEAVWRPEKSMTVTLTLVDCVRCDPQRPKVAKQLQYQYFVRGLKSMIGRYILICFHIRDPWIPPDHGIHG